MYIEKGINSLGKFISLMIPVMTILMIVIIVARYFFGIGLTGLQEFVMYLHAFIFLGCAGYVHYKDEHVRVDIFYRDSSNSYKNNVNFILINPGAFTHTSIAIRDALLAVDIPFYEIHLSNTFAREDFRHKSYFSDIARGCIIGLGSQGYKLGLAAAIKELKKS